MTDWLVRSTPFGLTVAYFAAHQGGKYYPGNLLQEIGLAIVALLYVVWLYRTRRWEWCGSANWTLWMVFVPGMAISFVAFYAMLFAAHSGAPALPSALALRYFGFALVAPIMVASMRGGVAIERHERAFLLALVALIINYTFNYVRLDLESVLHSGDRILASMTVWDEWRGFRLKPNFYSLYLLVFVGVFAIRRRNLGRWKPVMLLAALAAIAWIAHLRPRAGMLSLSASSLLFWLFLSSPRRTGALFAFAPVGALVTATYVISIWSEFTFGLRHDWSFVARMQSFSIALDVVREYPFFGYGQRSFHSISYQDLFGEHFFPGDIGIMGIAFRNGLVGVLGFLFLQLTLTCRAVGTHWAMRRRGYEPSVIMCGLSVLLIGMTFLMVTEPALIFEFGFALVPITLGFTAIWQIRLDPDSGANSNEGMA